MIPGKVYTPFDIVRAAWRRRFWILAPFAVISIGALAWALSMPYSYRSFATVQVLPPQVPEGFVRPTVPMDLEDRLPSIGQQILTRSRLERIIDAFDLYAEMRQATVMENVIDRMRKDIVMNAVERDVIEIGFTSQDPELALRVAQGLTDLFIQTTASQRAGAADAATDFLAVQLADARGRLGEVEGRLEEYRSLHAGELPSQQQANMSALAAAQTQLRTVVDSISRDREQRSELLRQLNDARDGATDDSRSEAAGGPMSGATAEQLAVARAELRDLAVRLKPEHPDVVRVEKLIERLEAKAASELGSSAVPPRSAADLQRDRRVGDLQFQIEQVDRRLRTQEAEERRMRASINSYTARIDAAPMREAELAALTRDHGALQALYSDLLRKSEDAKLAAELERGDVTGRYRILDPARVPEKPYSPSRREFFLIGVLAGLLVGIVLAAFTEYRDSSLRTVDDVQVSLSLPVLATIPPLGRHDQRW